MPCGKAVQRMDANGHERDSCTGRTVKGLYNVGNSCYFNSVMQNLLAVNELRENFMKPTQFLEGPITSALRELYVETSSDGSEQGDNIESIFTWLNKGNDAVNPRNLFNAICSELPQFRGFRQQDSHELLRCLLDKLHTEELTSSRNSKPTNDGNGDGDGVAAESNTYESSNQKNNETLVDRVFLGQLCSTICCSKCGYHSAMYEPFYDLSLPIPSKPEIHYTSLKVQGVDNHIGEDTIAKSDFGLLGGCGPPFPYGRIDSVAGEEAEVTQMSTELNTADESDEELDVSVPLLEDLDSYYDIWNLSDEEKSSAVQERKIDFCETKSLLNGENGRDDLFKGMPVITEAREEEMKAAAIPMSVDGCLVEFTRPEILSGENGWKCPNCASNLVNGSHNLENTTAKEEQSVGFNGRLNAGSVQNIADSITKTVKDTELEVSTLARCLETSDTKTDDYQLHSGSVTCTGIGLNDNTCQQTEVLCNSNDIDNGQPSNQEGHQKRRGFAGHYSVPVHDSSEEGVSCSDVEGHSNKNVLRIFGAEDRSETDGINHAERLASTSSEEEGGRISAKLEKWDLESTNFTSSGEEHRLNKRSKTREDEANSNGISEEATKRYLISKAPPILIIHLKRFSHGLFGMLSKLRGHVAFQEWLDLRPYIESRSNPSTIFMLNHILYQKVQYVWTAPGKLRTSQEAP